WTNSTRPKNFAKSVATLKVGTKRKRHNARDEDEGLPARKIYQTSGYTRMKRSPVIETIVFIHYSSDCKCEQSKKSEKQKNNDKDKDEDEDDDNDDDNVKDNIVDPWLCTCDLWFRGRVYSECERNKKGNRVFAVSFDDGDDHEIEWSTKRK